VRPHFRVTLFPQTGEQAGAAGRNLSLAPERVSRLRIALACAAVILAVACFVVFDPVEAAIGAAGCAVLAAVTATDLERRIVPNRIVVPATVLALLAQTLRDPGVEWLLASLAAGGLLFLAALAYPAGMGMGDVKLAAFLGAWLGWDVFAALFVGILAALVPAVAILVRHGSAGRKMGIPFAPFLALGGVVALFAGDELLDWYLSIGG
jgi:leader peptidase (prepilin peptidase) / N-methyltransferase